MTLGVITFKTYLYPEKCWRAKNGKHALARNFCGHKICKHCKFPIFRDNKKRKYIADVRD